MRLAARSTAMRLSVKARRGVVLVAVIALLALGTALVAGAFAAARGSARSTRSARASIVADAAARRALARTLSSWSATHEEKTYGLAHIVSA